MRPAGPGTQQLQNKCLGAYFLFPLGVLLMLGSGSPAKPFVPLREKDPAVSVGEAERPQEGAETDGGAWVTWEERSQN